MASTYSTRLSIELPADGEQEGTWGQTLNKDMGTLIEEAIAGVVDINVASGDVTLSSDSGITNEARQAVLNVTGSPGVARNIIAPAVEKIYWVVNGSDAAVTIKTSLTSGVSIISGNAAAVAYTGSDFVLLYARAPGYPVTALGSVTGTATINCGTGNYFTATSTGVTTWSVSNAPASGAFTIYLQLTNGGAYSQTWMTGIKWPAATPPTLTASGVDVLQFITFDGGTNWRGNAVQLNSS